MEVTKSIEVNYKKTNNANTASKWLNSLPDLFAADFETAVRYTDEEILEAKEKSVDASIPKRERVEYLSIAKASALGHPYHCTITHCSMAYSEKDAYVFIIDNQDIADVVLSFIVKTDKVQIWHNYSYDGRFIMYYAGGNAKNVEDTQILAKTLLNHVDILKAGTSLKQLAGDWYGDWGISGDNFSVKHQHDEKVIKYAAIDSCATFKLYKYLLDWCDKNN